MLVHKGTGNIIFSLITIFCFLLQDIQSEEGHTGEGVCTGKITQFVLICYSAATSPNAVCVGMKEVKRLI